MLATDAAGRDLKHALHGGAVQTKVAVLVRIGATFEMRDCDGNCVVLPIGTDPECLRLVWREFRRGAAAGLAILDCVAARPTGIRHAACRRLAVPDRAARDLPTPSSLQTPERNSPRAPGRHQPH
jgi:hypothetical protein